ncbi:MAG: hypothetical protein ACT4QE_13070 [Anaerolineales bacterium]
MQTQINRAALQESDSLCYLSHLPQLQASRAHRTTETVTPFLAERVLANTQNGARIACLTPGKVWWRFMTAWFNKRDVFSEGQVVKWSGSLRATRPHDYPTIRQCQCLLNPSNNLSPNGPAALPW